MQQRKERSMAKKAEEAVRLQRECQEQLDEEIQLLKGMEEPQRLEYLRMKQIEEQRVREHLEERQRKEGERGRCLMEEARQEAMYFLSQKRLMEQDHDMLVEFIGLERAHNITRPWVFSYFQLIEILGLETPVEK
uniref:uncharacterized protein KIAA2012 homolog n=1 Tax=Pristiophorus japonicus TaxID=55135 RepID=UPI00398F40D8